MPEFTPRESMLLGVAALLALGTVLARTLGPASPPVVIQAPEEGPPATPSVLPYIALTGPISLNAATREELERLPGIGPKLAQRIVEDRALRGPFTRIEDLVRVKGIGPKLVERIRPYVRVP